MNALFRRSALVAVLLFSPIAVCRADDPAPKPLNKQGTVLLDKPGGRLILKTRVVLREGLLEMLVCKRQTKEHESILSIDAQAYAIHAGLLALGATPGQPVRFEPKFVAPRGERIEIYVNWVDPQGKPHRAPAQEWIRYSTHRYFPVEMQRLPPDVIIPDDKPLFWDEKHHELSWYGPMSVKQREEMLTFSQDKAYRKAIRSFYKRTQPREMDTHWVFAGSIIDRDEDTGALLYRAEGGDVICVANFPTAMLDVASESSASGESNLLFEPWTERIPPVDTEVDVELVPAPDKDGAPAKKEPTDD